MNEDNIGKLKFSFTDEYGEKISVKKTYPREPYESNAEFSTIWWLLDEFKDFLKAMGFGEFITDRIVYLKCGEKVINENGEVVYDPGTQI